MDLNLTKADNIDGFMYIDELCWLAEQAHEQANILEIGSWKGRSTRAMADNSKGHITVIDPFYDGYLNGMNLRLIFESNLREYNI